MNKKQLFSCFLIFSVFLLITTSVIYAEDSQNNTSIKKISTNDNTQSLVKDTIKTNNSNTKQIKETPKDKTIVKNTQDNIKTASRPVSYNIKIYNNVVANATIEVGVIDYYTSKAIPNSVLKIKLPSSQIINAKTSNTGYSNITMNLPYGKNRVNIIYDGTGNYSSYDYDLDLDIVKRNTNMHVNVDGSNTTGHVNLTTQLRDVTTGNLIKNAKIQVTISDGQKLVSNTGTTGKALTSFKLATGRHFINVTYLGDSTYNTSKASLNLTIGTPKNMMDYDVTLNNLYVGTTSITIKTKDFDTKKALPNTPIKVKFSNGKQYSLKTDKNAQITFKPDIPVGRNDMNIIFDANSTYYSRNEKINLTVNKRVSNLTVVMSGDVFSLKLNASLKDLVLNTPIKNAPVKILVDGKTITAKTSNTGFLSQPLSLKEGNHTIKVTYDGTVNITNMTRTVNVNIPKAKTPVTYNVTVLNNMYLNDSIMITLIDVNTSKAMPYQQLTVKLPAKTIILTTNSKGQVTFRSNMTPGTNNMSITYSGNTKYSNNTAKVPIIINKRPSSMNISLSYGYAMLLELTLKDSINAKVIPNATIQVKHPKKTITLKTDKNGKISSRLDLPEGKAKITVVFPGNTYYNQCNSTSNEVNFPKIIKNATIVTVDPVKGIVGDKITLTAYVKDTKQAGVTGGNIVFKINGKTLRTDGKFNSDAPAMKLSVKNGKVSTTILADKYIRDAKNISASYSGNIKYYENNTKTNTIAQIQLRHAQLKVTATPSPQKHYNTITFAAKVEDTTTKTKTAPGNDNTSYVFFKINGRTLYDSNNNLVKAKVVNGIATYKYIVPAGMAGIGTNKKVRNYTVTAGFYHPNYYPNTNNKTTFQVTRSNITFNVSKAQFDKKSKTLLLAANIQDIKKNNVIGNSKINIKVNGKTLTINNKQVFVVKDGKIYIQAKIPSSIEKVKSVTIVCGERCAYLEGRTTITNIKEI